MSDRFPHGITVTVRRSTGTDRNGDPLPVTQHQVAGCGFDPGGVVGGGSREVAGGLANTITTAPSLLCGYDADVTGTDEILLPGDPVPWFVDGDPLRYRSPLTGWEAGCKVPLTRTRG